MNPTPEQHSAPARVQIFVKHAGRSRTLEVCLDWTVGVAKRCVTDALGVDDSFYRYHRLHYGGKDMVHDGLTLRAYGVHRPGTHQRAPE